MNHFRNKKFNLIKFGKSAIAISTLALPAFITTTTNAMLRNPRGVSTLLVRLNKPTPSSSPTRSINIIKTSTGSGHLPKSNLSGESYKTMASINTNGTSSILQQKIKFFESSGGSTISTISTSSKTSSISSGSGKTSTPTSVNVSLLSKKFSSPPTTTTTSTSNKTSSPTSGNVSALAQKFSSSSTTNTTSSKKTPIPSKGNVNNLIKFFSR